MKLFHFAQLRCLVSYSLIISLIFSSCSLPQLSKHPTRRHFADTILQSDEFRIQNDQIQNALESLPVQDDPLSNISILTLDGDEAVEITTKRAFPKNLETSFRGHDFFPSHLNTYTQLPLTSPDAEQIKTSEIQNFLDFYNLFEIKVWEGLLIAQQEAEQQANLDVKRMLTGKSVDSLDYQQLMSEYREAKSRRSKVFITQQKNVKEAFEHSKLEITNQIAQKYSNGQGMFQIQACNWLLPWSCVVEAGNQLVRGVSHAIAKTIVGEDKYTQQVASEIDKVLDEVTKWATWTSPVGVAASLVPRYDQSVIFATPTPVPPVPPDPMYNQIKAPEAVSPISRAQVGSTPDISGLNPPLQTRPEPVQQAKVVAEPENTAKKPVSKMLADTLSFLMKYGEVQNQGAGSSFVIPIFISDILEKADIDVRQSKFYANYSNCHQKRVYSGLNQVLDVYDYKSSDVLFSEECDIAVGSLFYSLDSSLKDLKASAMSHLMEKTQGQNMGYNQPIHAYVQQVEDYIDAHNDSLSNQIINGQVHPEFRQAERDKLNQFKNSIDRMIQQHLVNSNIVSNDPNEENGSITLGKANGSGDLVLETSIQNNIFGVVENAEHNSYHRDWLIELMKSHYADIIYTNQETETLDPDILNKIDDFMRPSRDFKLRIISPPRCGQNITEIASKNGSAEHQFGAFTLATSSENFIFDGGYTFDFGYTDSNEGGLWTSVIRIDNVPLADMLKVSVKALRERAKVQPLTDAYVDSPQKGKYEVPQAPLEPLRMIDLVLKDNSLSEHGLDPVGLQIRNITANYWDLEVRKQGNPNCLPAYRAVCMPHSETSFKLDHVNYGTGVYDITTRFSQVKDESAPLNSDASQTGIDENGYFYGKYVNHLQKGSPYAYRFVNLRADYKTFTYNVTKPSLAKLYTTLDNQNGHAKVSGVKGFATFISPGKYLLDTPEPFPLPNTSQSAFGDDENTSIPRAVRSLVENPQAFEDLPDRQSQLAAKNLFYALGSNSVANTNYWDKHHNIFNPEQNYYLQVGAAVNLMNEDYLNNQVLFAPQRDLPMKLVVRSGGPQSPILRTWYFDAKIGAHTFFQTYWDGSLDNGSEGFAQGNYRFYVEYDYNRLNENYLLGLSSKRRGYGAHVAPPVILSRSSQAELEVTSDVMPAAYFPSGGGSCPAFNGVIQVLETNRDQWAALLDHDFRVSSSIPSLTSRVAQELSQKYSNLVEHVRNCRYDAIATEVQRINELGFTLYSTQGVFISDMDRTMYHKLITDANLVAVAAQLQMSGLEKQNVVRDYGDLSKGMRVFANHIRELPLKTTTPTGQAVRESQVSDVNSHIVRYQELVREIYTFMGTKKPEQLTRSDLAKLKQWHSELKSIESSLTRYAQAIDPGFKALNTLAQYVQVIPPLMTSAAFAAGAVASSPVVVPAVIVGASALAATVLYYGAVAELQVIENESSGGNNGGGSNGSGNGPGPNYGQLLIAVGVAGVAMARNNFELMYGYNTPTETIENPLGEDLAEYGIGTELASDTSKKNTFKIQLSYFKNLIRETGAKEECEDPKSALTESKKRQLQGWENHDAVHHVFHQIDVGDLAGTRSIDGGENGNNEMKNLFDRCYRDDTDWQDPDENPGNNCGGESAANGVLLQSQFHSIVHTSVARRNLQNFAKHIDLGNQIPPQCQNLIDDGPDVNKCRQLHQLLENVLKPYLRILNGQAKTLSASNALNFIKTNPQLAVSVLKDPNTAIAASATLAQILLPLYQWKGAPNVEVKMPNNPKTYRWTGQNFGNVSRLYQTAPISSIRTPNTEQIKANLRPIYATTEVDLGILCQEAKSVMNQYGQ